MADNRHILFISSWYPNPADPTLGIFNKYFARAAALYNRVTVLNVVSANSVLANDQVQVEQEGKIKTITVLYKKVKGGLPGVSQTIKRSRLIAAFETGYQTVLHETGKPDLIQLNVVMPMGVGVLYLAEKYNIPFVVNENWSGYTKEDGNYSGLLQKYFTRKIIASASAIMPTSTYLRDAMMSHGLTGNYHVIPNVVDVNVFKPEVTERDKAVTTLIHVSSLNDREKNVSGLIHAFSAALYVNKDLHLNIVGEGIDKTKYIQLVNDLRIAHKVTFLGRLFSSELVTQVNAADALIMFSNFETFCLVIIEAFACGKPVVTSDAGAIKTYMKPELGIMVPTKNEPALTEAILKFSKTKNNFDQGYIRQYAIENYSYENVGLRLNKIYEESLKRN